MPARGIRAFGKVQGVFFRASAKSIAEDLGLVGWVRNESDGTVLIHAEGAEDKLLELQKWCEEGPEFAKVNDVQVWDEDGEGLSGFEIRRN